MTARCETVPASQFSWFSVSPDSRVSDCKIISEKVFLKWTGDLGREKNPEQKEQDLQAWSILK